jgi:spermidine/putrescine transport system permease protein
MSTAEVTLPTRRSGTGALARVWAFVKHHVLTVYSLLFFAYLMLPIGVVIAFSFNNPKGRFNYTWQGFTWKNWSQWNAIPGIQSAVILSLEIAVLASIVATALGTIAALALVRYGFRGRAATNLLVFLPLSTPEIVLGASLATLFLHSTDYHLNIPFGFWTILIAHVMFCISFAVVTVKARLIGFDRHLEEAAMDLGANEWVTFRKVTLPLIAPAILAAFLLCFAISVDDFVVTYFNAGNRVTFPIFVWGAARVATPPQINVIGTAIFTVAVTLMLGNVFLQRVRESKGAV